MALTSLTVRNFKSFGNVAVELRDFNVLVGANASGKSNLIEVFKFLKDIISHGLEYAISAHGGPKSLRNLNSDDGDQLNIRFETNDVNRRLIGVSDGKRFGVRTLNSVYEFELRLHKRSHGFSIVKDEFFQELAIVRLSEDTQQETQLWMPGFTGTGRRSGSSGQYRESKTVGQASISLSRKRNGLNPKVLLPERLPTGLDPFPRVEMMRGFPLEPKELLLESPILSFLDFGLRGTLEDTRLYDFDPKKPKQAVPITWNKELESDAGNLAVVLQPVLARNSPLKQRFVNLVADLLPFVEGVGIDAVPYNTLLTRLRERRSGKPNDMPASLASDGTISVIALITALFFQDSKLAIFEEPERNIHPYLIGRLVQMMKEASENTQILVTTHNPEVVRYADLEDILLVTRGSDGCSSILRPANSEIVKTFLSNDLGVQDLFTQDLLEV